MAKLKSRPAFKCRNNNGDVQDHSTLNLTFNVNDFPSLCLEKCVNNIHIKAQLNNFQKQHIREQTPAICSPPVLSGPITWRC